MKRNSGFTLIELVIAVAILAIIATVGYPWYAKQMQKARRADAKVALQSVALAQEQFFTVNGIYAATLGSLSLDASGIDTATGKTPKGYYVVTIAGDGATYDLTASAPEGGAQDGDSCGDFTLDYLDRKDAAADNCW